MEDQSNSCSVLDVWAVVPIKQVGGAKQRLARALSPELRRALALAMAHDVLAALSVAGLAGIVVVTTDPTIKDLAGRFSARIINDAAQGETAAVNDAVRTLTVEGQKAMLVVPADIPLITAEEIRQLLYHYRNNPEFIIVPARDERGSNAILCAPPNIVSLEFGNDSFVRHLTSAKQIGVLPKVVHLHGIGLDIDYPRDLARFLQAPSHTRSFAMLKDADVLAHQSWFEMTNV